MIYQFLLEADIFFYDGYYSIFGYIQTQKNPITFMIGFYIY